MAEAPLRPDALPRHVAIIMDGNGRWAEARGLPRSDGHRAGVESVRTVVRAAREIGIPWLTLYAFSSENWQRPPDEVDTLMQLPEEFFETEIPDAIENGVRIEAIGRRELLPERVQRSVEDATARTRHGDRMRLVFALSYGGRAEIVDATRRILRDFELGKVSPEALDEKTFATYLDHPELPDVDLLIRTGSQWRISNFLLWQSAYAEISVTDVLWPDFGRGELERALRDFQSRERRYGRTSSQVRSGGEGR